MTNTPAKKIGILLDVDGTLYHSLPLRLVMSLYFFSYHILFSPFKLRRNLAVLLAYRKSLEIIRKRGHAESRPYSRQMEMTAIKTGESLATVTQFVNEWFETRHLLFLPLFLRIGVKKAIFYWREKGYFIGVFSDYPAKKNINALGLSQYIPHIVSAADANVKGLKPHSTAFTIAAKKMGLPPENIFFIGDRPEIDGVGAKEAGMQALIISSKGQKKPPYKSCKSFKELETVIEKTVSNRQLKSLILPLFIFLFSAISQCFADDLIPLFQKELTWPPPGIKKTIPLSRDTLVSSVPPERDGNNGSSSKLKLKGSQEYSLFDIDLSSFKGSRITGGLLHLRSASPEKGPLGRVGISTLASEWKEGGSWWYMKEKGSATFNQAKHGMKDWAYPGSSILDVIFGKGNTFWKFSDCSAPDQKGWQRCAVDADVIAARIAGLSHGFVLSDEVGNTWSFKDEKLEYHYFPNRFFYGKDSWGNGPKFDIWTDGHDTTPPHPVKKIEIESFDLPAGQVLLSWKTPADRGKGKVLGFYIDYFFQGKKKAMPRYLIPMAGKSDERVKMYVRDLGFKENDEIIISIRSVDRSGNASEEIKKKITFPKKQKLPPLKKTDSKPWPSKKSIPLKVDNLTISVVDLLDKVNPDNGHMIPHRKRGYKKENHLFSASEKEVTLFAAKNETVFFQVNIEGRGENISLDYTFSKSPGLKPKIFKFGYIPVFDKSGKLTSNLPDPLLPVKKDESFSLGMNTQPSFEKKNLSFIFELYIPHNEKPGTRTGVINIFTPHKTLAINVNLKIWNFTLPNKLSFVPEMNAYNTVSPYKGYSYYRLAHEHRTVINLLPYGWDGKPSFAPEWDGKNFDWKTWDKKIGPLLDGSAFMDLPREEEPVDVFYLPFNENWPVKIHNNFTPSYWIEEALDTPYQQNLKSAFKQFSRHLNEKNWTTPIFQFYLNNKIYYRKKQKTSTAPWLFDEPANTQDFWALRWYGILFQSSVRDEKGSIKMWFRGDISQSENERNILWGITDIEYLGENSLQKMKMKAEEKAITTNAYFAEYGSLNRIEADNMKAVIWSLSAWSRGAQGILPWQTIGNSQSWKRADKNALFYPHSTGPKASVRLKALTVGQQVTEYLSLLAVTHSVTKEEVSKWLQSIINLKGNNITPKELFELRLRVGNNLSAKAPPYKRALFSVSTQPWKKRKVRDLGSVTMSPRFQTLKPQTDNFYPQSGNK